MKIANFDTAINAMISVCALGDALRTVAMSDLDPKSVGTIGAMIVELGEAAKEAVERIMDDARGAA